MSNRFRFAHCGRLAREAFATLTAGVALSCTDNEGVNPNVFSPPLPAPAVRVVVAPTTVSLLVGTKFQFQALSLDSAGRAVAATFEWTSSDPAVATINRTDGVVTAIAIGQATMTVSSGVLSATAVVTVRPPDPPAALHIAPDEVILPVGGTLRLTATATDAAGKLVSVSIDWNSDDPAVATIDRVTGVVTAIGVGSTAVNATVGNVKASIPVRVEPPEFLAQWAANASASSEYSTTDWSALQAIGLPDVNVCADEPHAWASLEPNTIEWLELTYKDPVRPSEILIREVWAPGSIVKVEVRDLGGTYHVVYQAAPNSQVTCVRNITIRVDGVTELVNAVRVTVDQRTRRDWNEIDAVRLSGYRNK